MTRPWTMAQIDELRRLVAKGKLTADISEALNRSYESVQGVALRHGIVLNSTPGLARSRTAAPGDVSRRSRTAGNPGH